MKSMTGYGSGSSEHGGVRVESEIHSVNHRGLAVQVYGPREWGAAENELTTLFREKLSRGKVTVTLNVSRVDAAGRSTVDWSVVEERVNLFREAYRRFGKSGETDISVPPDVLYRILGDSQQDSSTPLWDDCRTPVLTAADEALTGLVRMRVDEGFRLRKDFEHRAKILGDLLGTIREHDAHRIPNHRDALLNRLKEMNLELDPTDERVAREVAFFADRSDISEETARVDSHLVALEECFSASDPTGRRIEFLLQEILREFNTMGSKATLPEISNAVIDAKQEIEKLREQAANIE